MAYIVKKGGCLEEDIEEEVADSAKYMKMYAETGDQDFKALAEDEARHASVLRKKRDGEPVVVETRT